MLAVAALIIQKPSSVIVEEGDNVTLLCKARGRPIPNVKWVRALSHLPKGKTAVLDGKLTIQNVAKADSGTYACSAKNLLGKDSAFALITVTDRLEFTQTPPLKVSRRGKSNRPFPSSKKSHFQNEDKCQTFVVKMSFICIIIKTHFHINGFALSLALKVRFFGTRK